MVVGRGRREVDIVEIREVLARYMRAMRLGDVDLMDDVFLPDAIIDYTRDRRVGVAVDGDQALAAGHDRRRALHAVRR